MNQHSIQCVPAQAPTDVIGIYQMQYDQAWCCQAFHVGKHVGQFAEKLTPSQQSKK
jgi:hypothetical protein